MTNQSISIQRPGGEQFYKVGEELLDSENKKMGLTVVKITYLFSTAKVYFSNGEVGIFRGFPFTISKK